MKRRVLSVIIILLSMVALTGCWDYLEYEHMAKAIAIGIDYNNNTSEYTVSIQHSSGAAGIFSRGKVYSATAKTYVQTLSKLQQVIQDRLFYGYTRTIILGQDAVKYKMHEISRLYDWTPSLRGTTYLIVTPGKAENVLATIDTGLALASSEEIYRMIDISKYTGISYPVTIEKLTEMMVTDGWEATIPGVLTSTGSTNEVSIKGGTMDGIRLDEAREGDEKLSQIAAFKGERFAGWLGERESRGFLWLTDKNITPYRDTMVIDGLDTKDVLYYRVLESSSKTDISFQGDMPVINVRVKVTADITKYYCQNVDRIISPEEINAMQERLSESIRLDTDAAVKCGQKELKTDIFGFGFALFRKYPGLWREKYKDKWNEIYPDIPVNILIDAKVINTGVNMRTLQVK